MDPRLLGRTLRNVLDSLSSPADAASQWDQAREVLTATGEDDAEVQAVVDARDGDALRALVEEWDAGKRLLPEHDRTILKRALKAFRKSLKLTRLDAESSIGGGPMSGGRESSIAGITPPAHYPREVWDELVRQGRLIDVRHGMYELVPD